MTDQRQHFNLNFHLALLYVFVCLVLPFDRLYQLFIRFLIFCNGVAWVVVCFVCGVSRMINIFRLYFYHNDDCLDAVCVERGQT